MKFSVATASYNGLSKIKRCIGSVRSQVSETVSVEHIVQDGLSSDGTEGFLNEYKARCKTEMPEQYTFHFLSESDSGMYNAINKAWARSSGDILSWLNVDEQYLPETLKKAEAIFTAHPDVDIVWGNFICVNEDGSPRAARIEIPARYHYLRNMNSYMASCTVFFRQSLWQQGMLQLDESYRVAADHDLYLRLLRANVKMFHVSDYLSLFEMSDKNLSVTMHSQVIDEGRRIFKQYGSFKNHILRKLIISPRWIEKLFKGSYTPRSVSYRYILDEDMNFRDFYSAKLDPRFRF